MIFELELQNERKFPVDRARLRQAVETVLSAHAERFTGRAPALTIVLTDDDSVRALHLLGYDHADADGRAIM